MVRHKTRWLLVRLDFNSDVAIDNNKTGSHNNKSDHKLSIFPSKNELTSQLRQNIVSHFGLVADSVAMDTQVRLWDPATRLLLLRVPREECGVVRSSLTLWTTARTGSDGKTSPSNLNRAHQRGQSCPSVVASVIAVHGSARTAKMATVSLVRKIYRGRLRPHHYTNSTLTNFKRNDQECERLQDLLRMIQNID